MVIDTSAVVAILFDEPDREQLVAKLAAASTRAVSAGSLLECGLVVEARRGEPAGRELDVLLHRARVEVVPVDEDQVLVARAAWRRFGKGRHRASLNYGDLFAYALARCRDEPLLFVGDDFTQTDVVRA